MSVARQLFELQEVDLQAEAMEKSVRQMTAELGESDVLRSARAGLAEEQKRSDGLVSGQRSLDWEIEDLGAKQKNFEKDLYGGRIRVPKELSSLQQEVAALKARRTQLEDKALVMMEQIESSRILISKLTAELRAVEIAWRSRQDDLNKSIESGNKVLLESDQKRQQMVRGIEGAVVQTYQTLRRQKGAAVARVEQGICRGCRISLPSTELQRARSGALVQCSSCGRILYLP